MSQVPPPFTPPAPTVRRDRGPMIILFIILGLAAFCIIAFVVAGFLGFNFLKKNIGPMAGCMVNFQVTRDSLIEYANTHGGKLPNAATWQDDIKDIVKKRIKEVSDQPVFETLPPDGEWGCKYGDDKMTGIAFNSDLSNKDLKSIAEPWSTPLIFETEHPKRNNAEKYVPKDIASSPTLMGEHRGWVVAHIEGDVDLRGGAGRWRTNIEAKSSGEETGKEPDENSR